MVDARQRRRCRCCAAECHVAAAALYICAASRRDDGACAADGYVAITIAATTIATFAAAITTHHNDDSRSMSPASLCSCLMSSPCLHCCLLQVFGGAAAASPRCPFALWSPRSCSGRGRTCCWWRCGITSRRSSVTSTRCPLPLLLHRVDPPREASVTPPRVCCVQQVALATVLGWSDSVVHRLSRGGSGSISTALAAPRRRPSEGGGSSTGPGRRRRPQRLMWGDRRAIRRITPTHDAIFAAMEAIASRQCLCMRGCVLE